MRNLFAPNVARQKGEIYGGKTSSWLVRAFALLSQYNTKKTSAKAKVSEEQYLIVVGVNNLYLSSRVYFFVQCQS